MARDWISDPEVKASIRTNHEKVRAMTDTPTPSVQPVRAWAVKDARGYINADTIWQQADAAEMAERYDAEFQFLGPHRVILVEIREVNDE